MTDSIDKDLMERCEYQTKLREELKKCGCPVPKEKRTIEVCGALDVPSLFVIPGTCKFSPVCTIKKQFTFEEVKNFLWQKERGLRLTHWKINKTI